MRSKWRSARSVPRTVATLILQGRDRQLHPRYAALASHYVFDPRFCMPARGKEKPDAEGTVKAVQRRFATPVPCVADLDELNTFFLKWCEAERARVVQSLFGPFTIADRLAEDLAAALPLPRHRFDPCVIRPAVAVDKYQSVAFDNNRYSVPRPFAFRAVAVKGYVGTVTIVAEGQAVATHPRCLRKHQMIIDPIHYLATWTASPASSTCAGVPRLGAPRVLRRLPRRTRGPPRRGAGSAASCGSCNCSASIPDACASGR